MRAKVFVQKSYASGFATKSSLVRQSKAFENSMKTAPIQFPLSKFSLAFSINHSNACCEL